VGVTSNAPQPDDFGATFGIEEEYHLIDPDTFGLLPLPALAERVDRGAAGPRLRPEMLTSQLEAATDVRTSLDDAREAVLAMRAEAAAAAAAEGATILATSTHPTATLEEIDVSPRPRYQALIERFGTVVRAFNLCGCHVHASVPDLETAIAVMTHARPYLPLLSALTGSSPFHEGADTGYQSFRIAWLSLWQQGGTPPQLASAADYLATVDRLVGIGLVDGPDQILWELRPSTRYPTLEFRVADVCTDVDDVLLFAALVRALVRTLGARVLAGQPPPDVNDAVLRAARWRAARFGLKANVWDPETGHLVAPSAAVDGLLAELSPALRHFGDEERVSALAGQLLSRGTSAERQRQRYASSGDLRDVIRDAVELTARR
jgi:carboxylate-amine ligase